MPRVERCAVSQIRRGEPGPAEREVLDPSAPQWLEVEQVARVLLRSPVRRIRSASQQPMLLVQQFIEARRSAAQAAADVRKLIDASIDLEAAIEPWSRSCHALSMLERHRAVNPVESELTPLTSLTPACGPVWLGGIWAVAALGRRVRRISDASARRSATRTRSPKRAVHKKWSAVSACVLVVSAIKFVALPRVGRRIRRKRSVGWSDSGGRENFNELVADKSGTRTDKARVFLVLLSDRR